MGYGPEEKTTVLELTYNHGITKYDKGDAYAQVDKSSPFLFVYFEYAEVVPLILSKVMILRL